MSAVIALREAEAEIRIAPHNTEAEQALLGAIFRNNLAYGRVSDFLEAEHFANAVHARIYAAIGKLIDRGQVANPVTLKNVFDQDVALAEIGGAQYLMRLAESAVTIINAEDYARRIHDLHLRRQLIGIGEDVVNDAFHHDLDDPAPAQIERLEHKLFELAESGAKGSTGPVGYADISRRALQAAEDRRKRGGAVVGVATGFVDLDRKLGGLRPSHLIIVAGRPGMGKSSLALDISRKAAHAGVRTLMFSLEMPSEEIANRNFAVVAGVSADSISRGELSAAHFERLVAPDDLLERNLVIDDTGGLSVPEIRSRARRVKRRGGLGLIIVDHLHLLQAAHRDNNRVRELAEMTAGLKVIAKELGVPVVVLAQLNRQVESRDADDWRPRLADLRESGSIEQDADVVMFVYRKSYYLDRLSDPKDEKKRAQLDAERAEWTGLAQILIEKNRSGATATVPLAFNPELTTFSSFTRAEVR
jgi:replicative DNA helicase